MAIVSKAHSTYTELKKRRNAIRPKPVGFDAEWKPVLLYSIADEKAKKTLDPAITKGEQVFSAFVTTQEGSALNTGPLEKWIKEAENVLKGAAEATKSED